MPLILGTNSIKDTGFDVANSLRFNDGSSDYLNKTYGSAGNRKTWTFSAWLKLSSGGGNTIFSSYQDGNNWTDFYFAGSDKFEFISYASGYLIYFTSSQTFRDYSAWYHIVLAFDSTQATASNRIKFYVNGSQVTALDNNTYPTQNSDHKINSTDPHTLGLSQTNTAISYDGYMSEVCFIDGSQLDPTSFGEFDEDTGIWKPIDVSGLSFGTNGFYLPFENSGALGQDDSGNGNNFTVNNLTSIDQTTDTCTNNYCTLNPLDNDSNTTFSEGNCKAVTDNSLRQPFYSTFGLTQGKWYWEVKMIDVNSSFFLTGISGSFTSSNEPLGYELYDYGYRKFNGAVRNNDSDNSYGSSFADGDIIGVGLDLDNNKLYFAKNGTWENSADPSLGTGGFSITDASNTVKGSYTPAGADFSTGSGATVEHNFGNPPFSISSGNSDGNGFGNFEYAPPTNYFSLCSSNLAEYG